MNGWAAVAGGVGTLLSGLAAFVALFPSGRAEKKATEALEASPQALYQGLNAQVRQVGEFHEEALRRWQKEREGLERALHRERDRADGAELVALQYLAEVASMRIELAQTKGEMAELRAKVDAMASSH